MYGIKGNNGVNCDKYFAVQAFSELVYCTIVLRSIAKRLCDAT